MKGLFEHDVMSEPRDELIRLVMKGVKPILTIPSETREIRRAIFAYSGSIRSAQAMKQFIPWWLWPDLQVQIVTFEHTPDKANELLTDAADFCRARGYNPEVKSLLVSPAVGLLSCVADWDADLIVMGSSVKSWFQRRLFGTAAQVIRDTDRPLFLC